MERGLWLSKEKFSIEEFDESSGQKKFSGIAYSGGEITDRVVFASDGKMYDRLVIDVATAKNMTSKVNPSMDVAVFYNHDQNQILGNGKLSFTNSINIQGSFSNYTEEAKKIYGMMKEEGFPMQQSVYIATNDVEPVSKGFVEVNGRRFDAPIAVFRNGHIREVSLCPIGADPYTSAQVFSFNPNEDKNVVVQKGEKTMEKFTFMNDEQKEQFKKLNESDPYEAFQFALKLCPCQDAEKKAKEEAEAATKAKEDADKALEVATTEKESLAAKLAESDQKLSDSTKKVVELETELKKFEHINPALFAKETNISDPDHRKAVIAKTEEILKADPSMGYTRAFTRAKEILAA